VAELATGWYIVTAAVEPRPACARCGEKSHIVDGTDLCMLCWIPPHDQRELEGRPDDTSGRARTAEPSPAMRQAIVDRYMSDELETQESVSTALGVPMHVVRAVLAASGVSRASRRRKLRKL
jgi:hypothetical protein